MQSLEQLIFDVWEKSDHCIAPIHEWGTGCAKADYTRDCSSVTIEDKDKCLQMMSQTEKLVEANLAEALTSPAPYVRAYAELLVGAKYEAVSSCDEVC